MTGLGWSALALAVALSACQPEIGPDTYFCGPERFCPPDLACDDGSFTCVNSNSVDPFECPEGSQGREPNDVQGDADALGDLVCGAVVANLEGCIIAGDDADLYRIDNPTSCAGSRPHLEVKLRYPVATAVLVVEVLDDQGNVLATGEVCTPEPNFSGRDHACLELIPEQGASYFLRVRVADDAPDCDGACRHNQYRLDVVYPLA